MLTKKNIIILHTNGRGMCGVLRGGALASLAHSGLTGEFEFVQSPEIVRDEYLLKHTVAVVINRIYTEDHAAMVRHYSTYRRKFGLKILLDFDDLLWDIDGKQSIPAYNQFKMDTVAAGKVIDSVKERVDGVLVSTPWLGACWEYRFGSKCTVVPNFLPWHLYGDNSMRRVEKDIEKPVVLYGGTPTHYSNRSVGDFAGPWIPWLEDAVKNDRIELHVFGQRPGFLKESGEKVVEHPLTYALLWGQTIRTVRPDIYIAPLVENMFNSAKSDLKYSEACAIGAAMLGSWWKDWCPYAEEHELSRVEKAMTPEQLDERVRKICQKENFNAIMEHQERHARLYWLENRKNTDYLMKAICGDAVEGAG